MGIILANVCGCVCLLFRIAFWMPSMGGGSHVTGPETCGPLLLPNPNLRQDKGCQWAAKIRSLPWLLKCDDFRYRSLMNYFRLKKFARVQTCDGFKLLLKSGITVGWKRRSKPCFVSSLPSCVPAAHKYHNLSQPFKYCVSSVPWTIPSCTTCIYNLQGRLKSADLKHLSADALYTSPFWVSYLFSLSLVPHIPKKIIWDN